MSEHLPPPPRRPAPDALRQRIEEDLDRSSHRRRFGRPLVTLVAAVGILIVAVVGVSTYRSSLTAEPATTTSPRPVPTAVQSGPPSAAPSSIPLDPRTLDEREISTTGKTCDTTLSKDERPPATAQPVYARHQRWIGRGGPDGRESTVLVRATSDNVAWTCVDGVLESQGWSRADRVTAKLPVWEFDGKGGSALSCEQQPSDYAVTGANFAVGPSVTLGRARVGSAGQFGPWQAMAPMGGYLHFSIGLTGTDAWLADVTVEYEFLNASGQPLAIKPYGPTDLTTTTKLTADVSTCHGMRRSNLPASTKAGSAACLKLAAEAADDPSFTTTGWSTGLVTGDDRSWGAVLRKDGQRFGCSLAPSREVSAVVADRATIAKSSFWFAVNPISATEGSSFWAAGRVPSDVTAISYELPGKVAVPASLGKDGSWMAMYHVDQADLATGDVSTWDPVQVTITRRSGDPVVYKIPFNQQTMCNQVSHGC